jgi:hypothetical protein
LEVTEIKGEVRRTATVRFAQIRLFGEDGNTLPLDMSAQLDAAFRAGKAVERRNRIWHFGRIKELQPGYLAGKVGYEDARETTSWDGDLGDFIDVSVPNGTAFPFVLDLSRGRLAYQAQKDAAILSAIQALLNTSNHGRWRVERIVKRQSWDQWRHDVSRVEELRFSLRRPNPNYVGRPRVEGLIESAQARLVRVVMQADPDELRGLDLEGEYVREFLDHAHRNYGSFKALGAKTVNGQDVEQRYDSAAEGAELMAEAEVGPDMSVPSASLAASLSTLEDDATTEADDDDDDLRLS